MKFVQILLASLLLLLSGCTQNNNEITNNNIHEEDDNQDLVIAEPEEKFQLENKPYVFEDGIHGITIDDVVVFDDTDDKSNQKGKIANESNVSIIKELDNFFEIQYGDIHGYAPKENIKYFTYDCKSDYTLAIDVSGFNYNREFYNKEDFESFLLKNNFNYAIIRLGGRGYGKAGNMYYDDKIQIFVDACEYLGMPYGFYFLDEAINEKEVQEEYKFVTEKIKKYNGKFHLLPLTIDMENQHGDGRADSIWEERVPLLNKLFDLFKQDDIDCMVYANGARIETYLKNLNCFYWTAAYTFDDKIPTVFYDDFIRAEEEKNSDESNILESVLNTKVNKSDTETIWYSEEYLNKVVAWQFTESGAKLDSIEGTIDLNLMDNRFFANYCYEIYK